MAIGTGAAVEVLAILSPHLHRAFATHKIDSSALSKRRTVPER